MSRAVVVSLAEVLVLDNDEQVVTPTETYPMGGIYSYCRGLFRRGPLDGKDTTYKVFHRVRSGHIVLSQLKGWEGAIALVSNTDHGLYLPPHNACFSVRTELADPRYIYWFLKQSDVWERLRKGSRGMGARRDTVPLKTFLDLELPLPSLREQMNKVALLENTLSWIEERKLLCSSTQQEECALLNCAFEKVAKGAQRARMADVAPLVRREVIVQAQRMYVELGIRSFFKGTFHRRSMSGEEFTWQKLFWIREGDIIFSNLMAWEEAVAVATSKDDGCVGNHRMLTCEANRDVCLPHFLHFYFRTKEGFDQILRASPGSIARNKTLSSVLLKEIVVPTPSLDAQRWFVDLQDKSRRALALQREATITLEQLMPAMISRVFGEPGPETSFSRKEQIAHHSSQLLRHG